MGYYTRHELQVDGGDYDKHCDEITLLSGYSELFNDITIKWYDHEKNMREHSAKYPDILFRLDGEGGESADIWIEYYKGGKMQRTKAKLIFAKFDEDSLI